MTFFELFLLAIGLSMDACALSMVSGMNFPHLNLIKLLPIPLCFGFFQGIMPLISYLSSSLFASILTKYAPIIAFILLVAIGGKMIFDSFSNEENTGIKSLSLKILLIQGIATSIDALAVGISLAALKVNIFNACIIIAFITFILSLFALKLGKIFGNYLTGKAEFLGGIILLIIAIKLLF